MRISDWSSDVCSSDLDAIDPTLCHHRIERHDRDPLHAPRDQIVDIIGLFLHTALRVEHQRRRTRSTRRIAEPIGDRGGEGLRPEERGGGKEGVSTGRNRWSPYHSKKKKLSNTK